jgi:transposase
MKIDQLILLPKFAIAKIEHVNASITVFASVKSSRCRCPDCESFSSTVHGFYYRKVCDLPAFQNSTVIILKTRKFKCQNPQCIRKVFSEQTPTTVRRYARRTNRVSTLLDSWSIELTGKLGSIISKQQLISVSISTITRIAHSQPLPVIKQPRVLGVDDWAFRKRVNYGTILVDMETSRPIALLPSRESADLKKWLAKYPEVEIFTRDRSGAYSSAINEACPGSIQIADRFHLFMNLSDALDTYFKSISQDIKKLIKDKKDEITKLPVHTDSGTEKHDPEVQTSPGTADIVYIPADQRLDTFNKVKELQAKGIPLRRISKTLGISRNTVRSYFTQESLSPRIHPRCTNFDVFANYILTRVNTKGFKVKEIIDEIVEMGFDGGRTQAYQNINRMRLDGKIEASSFTEIQKQQIAFTKPLNSSKLAKYIDCNLAEIVDPDEQHYMQTLLDNMLEIQIVRRLVRLFKSMLRRGNGNIRRWIDFIMRSKHKLAGLKNFANGLLRDIQAVENAICMPWSNGAVEGHVNRVKNKKRQMYGRASFGLLQRKVILSKTG